jgi:hypothetical protein
MPTSTKPPPPGPPPETLAAALAILQTKLPRIRKEATGQFGKYADLADVSRELLPILGALGLSFTARPTLMHREDGTRDFVLAYRLLHVSGEKDEGEYPLPAGGTPQQLGSAETYARRYSLCAITGAVADEDDDGRAAEFQRTRSDAELRGADLTAHNRLRRAGAPTVKDIQDGKLQRGITTDPGPDEFAAVDSNGERRPPGDLTGTYPPAKGQLGHLQAHFKRLGFTDADRAKRLEITGIISGRGEITTSSVLEQDEVKTVIKVLEKCRDRAQLDAAMAALKESEDAGA